MIINSLLIFFIGIFVGTLLNKWSVKLTEKNEALKIIVDNNNQFKQILEKLKTKRTRFKTRVNNTVYIGVKLNDYGKVDILYFLDKRDIAIFKGDKCIITSKNIDKNLLKEVIDNIERVHYHRIIDVVEILGFVFYREDFERNFNVDVKELRDKAQQVMKSIDNESDIQNIINKNNTKLDIDEILDKINRVGIENLTKEELDFLNNYNQ